MGENLPSVSCHLNTYLHSEAEPLLCKVVTADHRAHTGKSENPDRALMMYRVL